MAATSTFSLSLFSIPNPNKLSKPLCNPVHLLPLHSLNRYLALHALQHRGQEDAERVLRKKFRNSTSLDLREILAHVQQLLREVGIVTVSKDKVLQTIIGVGLVSEVLNESKLDQLPRDIAIGHVRYSTAGSSFLKNVQPFVPGYRFGSVGVAHNGNLVNYTKLSQCNAFSNTFTSLFLFRYFLSFTLKNRGITAAMPNVLHAHHSHLFFSLHPPISAVHCKTEAFHFPQSMAPVNLRTKLSVRRTVKCMANPRRVKMVAKQIMRELSDMLLTDTILQHAVLPEAALGARGGPRNTYSLSFTMPQCTFGPPLLGADRYLSSLTTISDVEVSNDLQIVKVYVSVFGDDRGKDVAIAGLKSKAKYVRSELGKRMKLRLTPEVRFIEDESMERGSRVIAILDKIKAEKGSEGGSETSDSPEDDQDWGEDDPDEDIIYSDISIHISRQISIIQRPDLRSKSQTSTCLPSAAMKQLLSSASSALQPHLSSPSGVGVASMGVMRPELVMKSIVPVVMAGVLGIYGLIIAVIISTGINPKAKSYYLFDGYAHLSSGLACGLAGLSAGMAIGIVGDAGVRANAQQPKLFVGMILILIFAEALALYGLIVGIILSSRAGQSRAE
ncbi:hypothetical protein IGI04_013793 [Brassica rapa subsp. trilocularis]|uniref:Glutamine amidotransferase type-2 domain-containing protein n=1 Tax=Brassica rapa subsp. trilocularis TaxID=1813537 RepID=A0ABQ7N9W3_BRACM|nr:hypothetical protein IGI04_013793 [Brassica rapa subsp. trilocularis]